MQRFTFVVSLVAGLIASAVCVSAQAQAQPFVYPSGLVEVPMSPVSDVTAMRSGRWSCGRWTAQL